ncbi:ABC transporter substrate-binding protein [Janibacter sp. YIM B02568]|uniref:ABC transporter substrate-binding protein n=1 Tax=Janibacter endophyticus TaxID=2806261 RepID=UPI00194E2483|nr:ABC transporter substrate-binding protein [Janibacter endophyticus]MBM6545434.1 ABC transporter substrate-binding protein [Janibacter endophyticus]
MRIRLSALTICSVAGLALVACGTPDSASEGSGPDSDQPIKIAIIPPSSGALAQFGSDAADAWQFAADEVNEAGGIDGRKVELIKMDTDATPATTLRAVREAVNQKDAKFIGGVMTSTEHGALNAQLEGLGVLSFNSLGKDDALTGKDCNANAFRVVQSTSMDMRAVGESVSKLPADSWDIQAVDYATGHNSAEMFKKSADEAGNKVNVEQFAPLNTTEFGTYISKLRNSDSKGLFAVEYGADGVAFVNQMSQFKLGEKYDVVLGFNMVSEPLFEALGSKVDGFYNNLGYDQKADNELNKKFVEDFAAKHDGKKPYYVIADTYLAAQTLFEGIKKAGTDDPEKVKEALNDLSFDSIVGEVTMRGADHQLIRPSYLGQIVKDDEGVGGLGWEIIHEASGEDVAGEPDPACKL